MFIQTIPVSKLGLLSLDLAKMLAKHSSTEQPARPNQIVRFINEGTNVVDEHETLVHLSSSVLAAQVALSRLGQLGQIGVGRQGHNQEPPCAIAAARGSAVLRELARLRSDGARFHYTEAIIHAGNFADACAAGRARFS